MPSEEELLAAACHIGHRASKWNPKMKPFIYGIRSDVHIFDLTKTRKQLEKTCDALCELVSSGKNILFVSTKQNSNRLLSDISSDTNQPVVTKKWIPGLLTNWKTISKRIKFYLDLQQSFKTGEVEKYTKNEQGKLRKLLAKLDNALSGVSGMAGLPDALFVVDAVRDNIAVREANTLGIPVYGICDSNADPDLFAVPIPANDDAVNSMKIILDTVKGSLTGVKKTREQLEKVA